MTGQPLAFNRFAMFTLLSMLIVLVAQSFGLMIGAVFNVVVSILCLNLSIIKYSNIKYIQFQNGTFLGPCLSVPMMMFAGFGVTLRDLPSYLYWGSYLSYLRYGLEGIVGSIYGLDRDILWCPDDEYCHFKYPQKFLKEISMKGDQFCNDTVVLIIMLFSFRIIAFVLLQLKLRAVR